MIITLQTLVFFRESLLNALDRLLRPYYKRFSLSFGRNAENTDDDESDDQVYAEFDDERGVVFFPPMYLQRYAAVSDCLIDERWCGKLEKVVDLGYHDMSFIKYLKEVPGIKSILGVDIESIPLKCSSDLLGGDDYIPKRENPLQVTLFKGNAADPDYRLIGCDAVIGIEMIEHMLPQDLERLIHTVFGFVKPQLVIFTTPNGDFNVLFKSMEKNGLRRLDHFFEWSREQFNDWCSNIVERYPQYTVSCKGIGPGPPSTEHVGCCSQMALFVAKEYHKQQELNMNSLALVAGRPSSNSVTNLINSWETTVVPDDSKIICTTNDIESYTSLSCEKQSCITLVLNSPAFSLDTLMYQDKMSQCNLDSEAGKNYLMFDYEQMGCEVVLPRRKVDGRVYVIEDVASRLNCTTLKVKKFSKATQNLLAKNQSDALVHTREVVEEIHHITKMLNFNKERANQLPENGTRTWNNINWGDNAPYWNQYYQVVKQYVYPFETKSEECRILDIISEEINRLIDVQSDTEFAIEVGRLEIPIEHLMRVVEHITDDVDKVKELLEWNGYEIVDNVVIHSRMVIDTQSLGTQDDDWQETETYFNSDWDSTDIRSTSLSDGSYVVQDYHARCLRRALDQKVRKLRSMLTADEDITSELESVICRLMKLALRTCGRRSQPPPTHWLECKLLDLLTLTEKATERRRRYFIENCPRKAIDFDDTVSEEMVALKKIKEDNTALKIVNKYQHLVEQSGDEESRAQYRTIDFNLEDDISVCSADLMIDNVYLGRQSPSLCGHEPTFTQPIKYDLVSDKESKFERTQAWLQEDIEEVSYPDHGANYDNSSGDTDHNSATRTAKYYKKSSKKFKAKKSIDVNCAICKQPHSKMKLKRHAGSKNKDSSTRLPKKISRKKSSNSLSRSPRKNKYASAGFTDHTPSLRKKEYKTIYPTVSKPIPASLVELCHPELMGGTEMSIYSDRVTTQMTNTNELSYFDIESNAVAETKQSQFIEIVMAEAQETIALRRTIGTDADQDLSILEDETLIRSVSSTFVNESNFFEKHNIRTDIVHSQTIFLYDLNEPTTSKGIRHIGMDVQCGPDAVPVYSMLSATTSFTKVPKMYTTGIKIEDTPVVTNQMTECGTCTNDTDDAIKTITPRDMSIGIKFKDSETNLSLISKFTQETYVRSETHERSIASLPDTKLFKGVASKLKHEKSRPEMCDSVGSFVKNLLMDNSAQYIDPPLAYFTTEQVEVAGNAPCNYIRPKLCRGGVQVHSYRDKQISEDIMFQGGWQKYRPKPYTKKKMCSTVAKKKIIDSNLRKRVHAKEILPSSLVKKDVKPGTKNKKCFSPSYMKKAKLNVAAKSSANKEIQKKIVPRVTKANKPIYKSISKVVSKVKVSSSSTKNLKSAFVIKKPPNITSFAEIKDVHKLKKNYVPLYLRRNIKKSTSDTKQLNLSLDSAQINIKIDKDKLLKPLIRSKTEEIKRDFLKFQGAPTSKYIVLRNEIEKKNSNSNGQQVKNTKENVSKKDRANKRAISPQSQNSSTSSPNSVATVRAVSLRPKILSNRRQSAASHHTANSGSESTTPDRSKKFTKRCKSAKSPANKTSENKENIPQSSRQLNIGFNNNKYSKRTFMSKNKDVFIAQLKENTQKLSLSTWSKEKPQKSNVNTPRARSFIEKSGSPTISSSESYGCQRSLSNRDEVVDTDEISNMVLVLERPGYSEHDRDDLFEDPLINTVNVSSSRAINDWINRSHVTSKDSDTSSIPSAMKRMIEETLDFIDGRDVGCSIDSETVILSREYFCNPNLNQTSSPTSFKTVVANEDINNDPFRNEIENALIQSFDSYSGDESFLSLNDTRLTTPDFDTLSFKSITSTSKYSETFDAENDINVSKRELNVIDKNKLSVRDIFERKDPRNAPVQLTPGALASQAFSGFTINEEIVAGDQPDRINLVDSETGSLAVGVARQATSEELFVSGRSSDSYQSCYLEEEAVVPNWLFQIISQQQAAEDEADPPAEVPLPLPVVEPIYDVNGNLDAVGAGAGAGDGRGMHSDHSRDSSGHGTSLSSSATSSEAQSEAILIDPATFAEQFELLRDAVESSVVLLAITDPSESLENALANRPGVANISDGQSRAHGESRRLPRLVTTTASDMDADISSIETDVLDSSDN